MRKRNLIIGGVATFLVLGAIGAAAGGSAAETAATTPTTAPAASTAPVATTEPVPSVEPVETDAPVATDEPVATATTEAPAAAANEVKVGQSIKVDDKLTVTVLDTKIATSNGQFQKPAKGYVYVGLKVRYEASEEALVSMNDWNVLADGTKQGEWTILIGDKWEPTLPFDQLAAGASVEGWITFEMPKPAKFAEVRFDNNLFTDDAPQLVLKVPAR